MTRLIEPRIATAVARRISAASDPSDPEELHLLQAELDRAVPRAEELVARFSGIPAPAPVRWEIIDRARWAEVNIAGMTAMLGPLHDKISRRLDQVPLPARLLQVAAVSAEVGFLLGYISKRVLGQYDLLVSEETGSPSAGRRGRGPSASLYFVGPNMLETVKRHGFVPGEFALWVALHEVTHRFQFEGVPWLRPRFLSLVHEYLGSVDLDAKGLARRFAGAARRVVSRSVPPEEKSPMYLFSNEQQRQVLDQIQALMAVVEGHGNFVMDGVGQQVIPSFRRMRHIFQRRRQQQSLMQRVFAQAIGLEMKLRQYEVGQRFCEGVAARGGTDALGHLWIDPSHFPTLEELRSPDLWLTRVAA